MKPPKMKKLVLKSANNRVQIFAKLTDRVEFVREANAAEVEYIQDAGCAFEPFETVEPFDFLKLLNLLNF